MRRRVKAGFQPPAYIASLIASINDGARAAQTGGLFMLAVAVYLMATVISTTDEVLLRGSFVDFSQIGVKVPVVASYALAPLVFLFLYVHTLIRYDMLAENLRLLDRELRTALDREADRDRCRQLLANVEFVQYWASPAGSRWHSWIYRVLVWLMLVAIPILVFLATQISFLRYQNVFVTYVIHLGCLAAALTAVSYFWYRQARRRQDWQPLDRRGKARTLAWAGGPSALMFAFAALFLGIPPPDSTTTGRSAVETENGAFSEANKAWQAAFEQLNVAPLASASGMLVSKFTDNLVRQPLDLVACPLFDWGCRFLRLDHRVLVQEKPEGDTLFKLRTGDGDLKELLLRVEALFLRRRSFRFADFSFSEFYDADFAGADLRGAFLSKTELQGANLVLAQMQGAELWLAQMQGANLGGAQMQGAKLWLAKMQSAQMQGTELWLAQMQGADLRNAVLKGAELWGAQMQGADLGGAQMQGESLGGVQMQGADLTGAQMQGADLKLTEMQGADLRRAQMQGADLLGAQMQGANLEGTNLEGANLEGAQMQGAQMQGAQMQGANLGSAQMQGADLRVAEMQGADLRSSALWQARFDQNANFSLADLRGIDLQPVPAEGLAKILGALQGISEGRRQAAVDRVIKALTPAASPALAPVVRVDVGKPALIDAQQPGSNEEPGFARFGVGLSTDDEIAYDAALAPFLADLARSDATVARGIAKRIAQFSLEERSLWPDLARRLLAAEKEGVFQLGLSPDDQKELKELAAQALAPLATEEGAPGTAERKP